jgi:ATP-dependent Clp protease ATP-binding subunit ClpB
VDFKNVIIIMTSNLGSDLILEAKKLDAIRKGLMELLKRSFRPEFLNRIDETVIFNRLGKDEINKIVDIQLQRLCQRLADRKVELKLTKAAKAIIAGKIKEGDKVTADKGDGKDGEALSFKKGSGNRE